MITPFHFACFCEERLRAQFGVVDPVLGQFMQILRRFSIVEDRAALQFGAKPSPGVEFVPHVTLFVELIHQKGDQTALNCSLVCQSTQTQSTFRLLLNAPEEAENQFLKILNFLQKAFLSLGYTSAKPVSAPVDSESSALEAAQNLMSGAGQSIPLPQAEPLSPEAQAVTGGKKYIFEKDTPSGEAVRLRTPDGKYVPEGELPATLKMQ